MNEFLTNIGADLRDRRLRPALILLGVAVVAALAYAVLGGGSKAASSAPESPAPVTPRSGIAVSQAPSSASQAIAEITSGASVQRAGNARNPFTPLPGSNATTSSTSKASGSSAASFSFASAGKSGGSSGSAGGGSAGSGSAASESGKSQPESTSKGGGTNGGSSSPTKPSKPQTVYHVAVLFGPAPVGAPATSVQLTPYENLKRQTELPSSKLPLVLFRGVTAGGKSAAFTLVGEAILRGPAVCRPNATKCEAIDLSKGQTEELEYQPPVGTPVTYRLVIAGITSSKVSAAHAARLFGEESSSGRALLEHRGLETVPGLRYSPARGVLVFIPGASRRG